MGEDKEQYMDERFNEKNIFTGKYEKGSPFENYKKMTQEDKDKFMKMAEDSKIEMVESLLYAIENNKQMEEKMMKIQDRFENFNRELSMLSESRKHVEENVIKIAEDLEKVKEVNKVKEKQLEIDESLFIEMYEITTKLKDILIEMKMSQTELCEKTGINKSTLSNIISFPEKVTLKNAYKIAKILKRPIEEIFEFDVNLDDYMPI